MDKRVTEDDNGARDGSERTLLCFGEWWNNQISEIGSAYRSAYLIQFPRSYYSFDACPRSTDLSTMCQEPETSDHLGVHCVVGREAGLRVRTQNAVQVPSILHHQTFRDCWDAMLLWLR